MLPNVENWNRENASAAAAPNLSPNLIRSLSLAELERHKLLGLAASRNWLAPEFRDEGHARLRENARREALARAALDLLARAVSGRLPSGSIGLLKGAALWGDLYSPGEREASDIDLHVEPAHELELLTVLREIGFDRQSRSRGRASNFKTVCLSSKFGDLSFEVHTKLWWREPDGFKRVWRPVVSGPFSQLGLEDQLVHLCGHWISQHTMISLHWLFDIVLFLEKYRARIDIPRALEIARELRVGRALETALAIGEGVFTRDSFNVRGVDLAFLREPTRNRARYFWVKHRMQDSWIDALKYDANWLYARLRWSGE